MIKKRAQAPIEVFFTYGWALLAIIIAGALIWLYFNANQCGKISSGFLGHQINLQDWTVHDDGSITLSLASKASKQVTITEIIGEAGTDDIADVDIPLGSPPVLITTIPNTAGPGNKGNCYREIILIIKYDVQGGASHVLTGRITGVYE